MTDETERLRSDEVLFRLLDHYARAAGPDAEAWQRRAGGLDGADAKVLTRLHGELLAHGWLEVNLGGAGGYRITPAGRRALRAAGSG